MFEVTELKVISSHQEPLISPCLLLGLNILLGDVHGTLVVGGSVLESLALLDLAQESAGSLVFRVSHSE